MQLRRGLLSVQWLKNLIAKFVYSGGVSLQSGTEKVNLSRRCRWWKADDGLERAKRKVVLVLNTIKKKVVANTDNNNDFLFIR